MRIVIYLAVCLAVCFSVAATEPRAERQEPASPYHKLRLCWCKPSVELPQRKCKREWIVRWCEEQLRCKEPRLHPPVSAPQRSEEIACYKQQQAEGSRPIASPSAEPAAL